MSLNIDSEMLLKHFPACQWSAGCVSAWGIIQHWVSFKNSQSLKPPPPHTHTQAAVCWFMIYSFTCGCLLNKDPPLSLEKCYSYLCRIMNEERGKNPSVPLQERCAGIMATQKANREKKSCLSGVFLIFPPLFDQTVQGISRRCVFFSTDSLSSRFCRLFQFHVQRYTELSSSTISNTALPLALPQTWTHLFLYW